MGHFLIAQMNGGRYQNQSVLSPQKVALMQAKPETGAFGMGWQFSQVNGHPVLHFEGGPSNFQASLFFDPQSRVGVFVGANVINALDVLSSTRSSDFLNGISARNIAESVLSLAQNQPLPYQGIGIQRLTLIFDLLILGLTGLMVASFARIPRRYSRLEQSGIASRPDLIRRIEKTSAIHFAWPLVLLAVALWLPNWIIFAFFQPDFVIWLYIMAGLTVLKGLLDISFFRRTFRRTQQAENMNVSVSAGR